MAGSRYPIEFDCSPATRGSFWGNSSFPPASQIFFDHPGHIIIQASLIPGRPLEKIKFICCIALGSIPLDLYDQLSPQLIRQLA